MILSCGNSSIVMAVLVTAIHVFFCVAVKTWMAGSSPAMTMWGS
jgi:hypothetical protein